MSVSVGDIRIWRIVPACGRGNSSFRKYRKEWEECTDQNKKDLESYLIDKYAGGISPLTLDEETIKTVCSLTVPERSSESAANAQIGWYLYNKFNDKNTPISEVIERMRQDKVEPISPVETAPITNHQSSQIEVETPTSNSDSSEKRTNPAQLKGVKTTRYSVKMPDASYKSIYLEPEFVKALDIVTSDRANFFRLAVGECGERNPASAIRGAIVEGLLLKLGNV